MLVRRTTIRVTPEQIQAKSLKEQREAIERRTGKSPEELYEEREKRVRDAIQLREPDRVPFVMVGGSLPKEQRPPASAAYYDPAAAREATKNSILTVEPDLQATAPGGTSGLALEALDPKHMKWPGGTLPPDIQYQAVEQEYMKEEEYDLFLSDLTDYTLRYLLPRAFGALAPLSRLPSLSERFTGFAALTPLFAAPEFRKVARTLLKAGKAQEKFNKTIRALGNLSEELASLGFPPLSHGGGVGGAPFDAISDNYRGLRGAMLDMYRQPDKLLAACNKILEMRIKRAIPANPRMRGNPKRTYVPLHRGAEDFMSPKQYETFYWPGLKKATLTSIDLGYVVILVCEGRYGARLEYLLEFPKGKVVAWFDQFTDIFRAKEVLRGHICIMGNVPPSLLQVGSPQEVEEYCRKLIKVCGKGGGFILAPGSGGGPPANVKAMVDSVKKYRP